MNKGKYYSIAIVAVVLGLMIALQFKSTAANHNAGVSLDRAQEIVVETRQTEKEIKALQQEVVDLSYKKNQANKGQTQASEALVSELKKVRLQAGILPVSGSGIDLLLENTAQPGVNPNLFAVRDEDLLKVINELRGAGAEAMSINGERIVATSEIRLAGSYINVNLTRLSPPYRIRAIGDPDTLKNSLEISGGLVQYFQDMGIKVQVEKKKDISVPAYTKRLKFEYARPVKEGEA